MIFYKDLFRDFRLNRGFTYEDIGKAVGVSKQAVENWEKGRTTPKAKNVNAVAKLLKISIVDISDLKPESELLKKRDDKDIVESNAEFIVPEDGLVFPVISDAAAMECNTCYMPLVEYARANAEQMIFFSCGKTGDFVIRVTGDSMMPWYPAGTLLLVRPNQVLRNGQRVVAVMNDGDVIFKIFAENDKDFFLMSINDDDGKDLSFSKKDFTTVRQIYAVIQSMRKEDDLDFAMKQAGISHRWERKLKEYSEK